MIMVLLLILLIITLLALLSLKKKTSQTCNNDTKKVEIILPLRYLSNFLRTFEMTLIYCEINVILTSSEKCDLSSNEAAYQQTTYSINDTKLFILVVTLSIQENSKLLKLLKSTFKQIVFWNFLE